MVTNLRIFYRVYITVFCVILLATDVYAIEPIATIGQPTPIQHAFLTNDTFVRVVPTHIQIVDTDTGVVIDEFGELTYSDDVVFSPKATHLAIQKNLDKLNRLSIEIWDVNTREQITQWDIEDVFRNAAFNPAKPMLATIIDNKIHLWNWQTGKLIDTIKSDRRNRKMVFSPDGKNLFITSKRTFIEVWNIESREFIEHIKADTGIRSDDLTICSNGAYLASYEINTGIIHVWDVESRQLLWTAKNGVGIISDIAFNPRTHHLYVSTVARNFSRTGLNPWEGWDDKIRVWNVKSGEHIDTIETKFRGISSIELSPDGNTSLFHYADGSVIWDIPNKYTLNVWSDFVRRWFVENPDLSPDGKKVVSLSTHFLKAWNVSTGQLELLISADGYKFQGFSISPDSKKVAVGKEPWIEIIDIQTGKVDTQILPNLFWHIEKMAFSQTGRWLAVSDGWNDLAILDSKNPNNFQNLKLNDVPADIEGYREFAFSEDDTYFVVSGQTGENNNRQSWIQLWKRIDDIFVFQYAWRTPEGTDSFVTKPAFTTDADGTTILAAPYFREIHIWNLLPHRAQFLTKLDVHGYSPVQFTQDGRYLFTIGGIIDWRTNRPVRNRSFPPGYTDLSKDGTILLSYNDTGQYDIFQITDILTFLPYSVESKGKQFVTLGQVKRNQLLQNFPNPFNPETWIPFRLADESDVTIQIYTPTGKLVRKLSLGKMTAGDYSSQSNAVYWDGRNNNGESIGSGVYLYTIIAGDFSATRKMLIRK